MTLRQYIIIMSIATAFCWIAWFLVLKNIDPYQGGNAGFVFFYLSLLLALVGTFSIVIFLMRRLFFRTPLPIFRHVQKSFHNSFFLSSVIIILLFLQGKNYLRWWNAGVFLAAVILIIFTKFTNNKQKTFDQT